MSEHATEQEWCDHGNDHIAGVNCRHCGSPPEYCELCTHVLDVHDFDIHNSDLDERFGPGVKAGDPVFPYELMCLECEPGRYPPMGSPTHDHFALAAIETESHICHIGPTPRWVNTPERPNQWLITYDPPPAPRVSTGTDAVTVTLEVSL